MAIDDVQPIEDLGEEAVKSAFGDSSIYDLLKQEAQELADAKEVFIRLNGYEKTGLQVCYRLPESGKELDSIARRVGKESKEMFHRNLYTSIDTMAWLCNGLYVQPEGVEKPVMLDPQDVGSPVHFDSRLAELLGMDNPEGMSARSVIRRLFASNDLAILDHAMLLNRWLQNTKADLSLEMWQMGEAQ